MLLRLFCAFGCAAALFCGGGDSFAAASGQADICAKAFNADPSGSDHRESCQTPTLDLSVALASAYVFRGYNVFQAERQNEQKWVARPEAIWTDSSERLSIGYTAAYQLVGDNLWSNIDKGAGSDQILFAEYDFKPSPGIVISPTAGMYLYPQASSFPLLLEGGAEVWYVGVVEIGAYVGYLGAVRPGPLTEDYLYLSPRIVKSFKFGPRVEFGVQLTFGAKIRAEADSPDNTFDFLAAEYLRYAVTDSLSVALNWALAWTNLGPREDPTTGTTVTPGFVDECVPFWGFTLGAEL